MDFGKFQFEQRKSKVAQRKKQKKIEIKEIKLRPTTDEADTQIKIRKSVEFLQEGDKVKVSIRFKGREVLYQEQGLQLLNRFERDLLEYGTVEQRPKMEGKQMIMVLAPKKK